MLTSADMKCNNCENILDYLKVFDKDFGKEFGNNMAKRHAQRRLEN